MGDFEKMGKELLQGKNGSKVSGFANSEDGKKVGKMVDGNQLKKAMMTGDRETMSQILNKVMSTDEGKSLVKKISESFGK